MVDSRRVTAIKERAAARVTEDKRQALLKKKREQYAARQAKQKEEVQEPHPLRYTKPILDPAQIQAALDNPDLTGNTKLSDAVKAAREAGAHLVVEVDVPMAPIRQEDDEAKTMPDISPGLSRFINSTFSSITNKPDLMRDGGPVVHPTHYNWHPEIECIRVSEEFNSNLGQAIQYIWRAGFKLDTPSDEDLAKAIYFIQAERDRLERRPL